MPRTEVVLPPTARAARKMSIRLLIKDKKRDKCDRKDTATPKISEATAVVCYLRRRTLNGDDHSHAALALGDAIR